MQLISLEFFALLALSVFCYNLAPARHRWIVLLAASLAFYLYAGVFASIFIIVISLSSYAIALLSGRQKEGGVSLCLYIGVLVVVSAWLTVKILHAYGGGVLPLGVSFYSLRIISYLIDVKHGRVKAERRFPRFLLFVTYFPVILQGPVVRWGEVSDFLFSGRRATAEEGMSGLILIFWGIFKKIVVANRLLAPRREIVSGGYSGAYLLFLILIYTAEIYCDFSGGIDIIRGASHLFGIPLKKNFDRPFSSVTLREFWNRWHISLGEWFESYVFYPLSLSRPMQRLSRSARARIGSARGRKIPLYIATLTTWLLTGLWHGTGLNFILWGLINGALVLLSLETAPLFTRLYSAHPELRREGVIHTAVARARVLLTVGALRLFDLYATPSEVISRLGTPLYDIESYAHLFSGGIVSLIPIGELLAVALSLLLIFAVSERQITAGKIAKRPVAACATVAALLLASLLFGRYGRGFEAGDFIYSRF